MKGRLGFEEYYSNEYKERWPVLKNALLADKHYILVGNSFTNYNFNLENKINWYPNSFETTTKVEIPSDESNLKVFYPIDGASLFPVMALDLHENDKVLDLCAAPGGKSLMMYLKTAGKIDLTSNDRSPERVQRIKKMMSEYVPSDYFSNWKTTKYKAEEWGLHEQNVYDKILVDVPCSSERHVLMDKKELDTWNIKRPKRLAIEQFAILCSALAAAKPGGLIVYSTCALSNLENDDNIEKLHLKRKDQFRVKTMDFPFGEKTKFGWQVLPDKTGHGPFYLSILEKL
jgi:16S rRNA C967 or C1407 C5-methylase (RsmB/RsmF family)